MTTRTIWRKIYIALSIAAILAVGSVCAAVQPGENFLVNGRFESEQSNVPPCWQAMSDAAFHCSPTDGPDGMPCVRIDFDAVKRSVSMRQTGYHLATGGCYRLSAFVRTKGLKAKPGKCGIAVPNHGWSENALSLGELPQDTHGQWKRIERECALKIPSSDGSYFVAIYGVGANGVLEVADLRLEAVDDIACRKTVLAGFLGSIVKPRLVPMAPLLWKIPSDDPSVEFRFFGKAPKDASRVVVKVHGIDEQSCADLELEKPFRVRLPAGATNGVFTAKLLSADGETHFSRDYAFAVVPKGKVFASMGIRLNNFVTELVKSPFDEHGEFLFALNEPKWVFVGVKASEFGGGFAARLDGEPMIDGTTLYHEAFRFLLPGEHRLEVADARNGEVVVRAVTETFASMPGVRSPVPENPVYDWNYEKKHGLPAIIVENSGLIPQNHELDAFLRRGHRRVPDIPVPHDDSFTPEALSEKLRRHPWLKDRQWSGIGCDEVEFPIPDRIDKYTQGLHAFDLSVSPQKTVYTWIIGSPGANPGLDHDFISTCINASRGRGRLMLETYLRTQPTETEAMDFIRSTLIGKVNNYRKAFPLSIGSLGVALGNYTQAPVISLAHHPGIDYKYYLDLQFNVAANDPACRGLGVIALCGQRYADDEIRRWSGRLLRHYAIEGARTMLSERYGFTYRPGHLENGDFEKGLDGWRTTGTVTADTHPRFGEKHEARWFCAAGVGDSFACLSRAGTEISMVQRQISGLRPGKRYRLDFFTFDVDNVKARRVAPRKIEIECTLGEGAAVDSGLSWVHVDKAASKRGGGQINIHHVVFTARSESVDVSFSNKSAPVGSRLGINGIGVLPYFE